MGWRAMDTADSEPMALVFIERLDRDGIPYQHYHELYIRAGQLRTRTINNGGRVEDFSADLMASCWPNLQAELKQREIDAGRTLSATAPTQCRRCHGTGMEMIYDADGQKLGVLPGCKHEFVDDDPVVEISQTFTAPAMSSSETAVAICVRVRKELAKIFVMHDDSNERHRAWLASATWLRAEKYCRANQETRVTVK